MAENNKDLNCEKCKCSNANAENMVNKLVLLAFYNAAEKYRQENANAIAALTEPPKPFKFGGGNE
jgi:hypothetical protein